MIVIYNRSGMLVVLASALIGMAAIALSHWVSAGAIAMAMGWIGLSFWWRNRLAGDGIKAPFPAFFFVPLPILAVPLLMLSGLMMVVESRERSTPSDPRAASLKNDVDVLKSSQFGGDSALSQSIYEALLASADAKAGVDSFHIFSQIRADAVLVLVSAPNLKKLKEPSRIELLAVIQAILDKDSKTKGKASYIGVRGSFAFGATRVPPRRIDTGSVLSTGPLLDFYGPLTFAKSYKMADPTPLEKE